MIPEWATHVGIHPSVPDAYLVCREGRWLRQATLAGGFVEAWTDSLSIRPITPEMRREALVAEAERRRTEYEAAHESRTTASEALFSAVGELAAFDRENGTGES